MYAPVRRTRGVNALALVTLVLGFVFPLAAIPIGHWARHQIARTGECGGGLALVGMVLGYLALGLSLLFLVLVMFGFGVSLLGSGGQTGG
jgi:Domain of unknown function (DUF4190)